MIPGWALFSAELTVHKLPAPLPVPHTGTFGEGALPFNAPGVAQAAVARTLGDATAAVAVSGSRLQGSLTRDDAYAVLLLDAFKGEVHGLCSCVLECYEADGATVAWSASSDSRHAQPYLVDPATAGAYAEQQVDFAEGRATISSVRVVVVDRQLAGGTKQDRWLTHRLAELGRTAIMGRRCRLRRWIDSTSGWVTVVDGPAGTPRLRPSFAGYEWEIRDTRESERKIQAFGGKTLMSCFPRGPLASWGDKGDGTFLLTAVEPLAGIWKSAGYIDFTAYLVPPAHFDPAAVADEKIILTPAMQLAGEPTANYWVYDVEDMGVVTPFYRHEYGNVLLQWRPTGETDWRTMPTLFSDSADQVGLELFSMAAANHKDSLGNTVVGVDFLYTLRALGTYSADGSTLLEMLSNDTPVDVRVLYRGELSETYPLYIETTAGQLLADLYDGVYTPDENGDPTPTGIRYDPAVLAEMTTPVLLRITEPADDLRAWAEQNIYAGMGYAPALNSDLEISPVSEVAPTSVAGLPELYDEIIAPAPGWQQGDRICNVLRYTYSRYYLKADEPDGIGVRDVTVEYRRSDSISVFGEHVLALEPAGFGAVGDASALAIGAETGGELAAARALAVLPRYEHGAPNITIRAQRAATAMLQPGDFAVVTPSWMPDYLTQARGLYGLAQVLGVRDLNCAWREFTLELVPLPEGS